MWHRPIIFVLITHLWIQQVFIECSLCAMHCSESTHGTYLSPPPTVYTHNISMACYFSF